MLGLATWPVSAATAQATRTGVVRPDGAALTVPSVGRGSTSTGNPRVEQISDERSITYWANPVSTDAIRAVPTVAGRLVGRLHMLTEDGAPEVYLVLRRYVEPSGRAWLRVRIPRRPSASAGWLVAAALGPLHRVATHLIVDRARLRAALYDAGREIWSSRVGIGAPNTPTPAGNFWIREKLVALRDSSPIYGPYALGTSAYSVLTDWPGGGVVGIHGTNQPQLIPGRPSHGCVRVPNSAITRLYHLIPIGTPVTIA